MASIIKNQLIRHLSKFAKNLTPDKISLDILSGRSKLQYIELNEDVLTEILELPKWLRIKKAFCTGVTVCVRLTKLNKEPIKIFIDEINVEVVLTTGPVPQKKGVNPLAQYGGDTSYGFANKVVEGMSLYINTVEINFDSDAFGGSFMLSRLSVESRTPGWQQPQDLRQTRVSCNVSNRTLMYKQISWQLLRVEASAKTDRNEKRCSMNANLRMITSGGKIRIALKKSSIDGSVINARIQMILEDILWVATLPQLRSALLFYSYIMNLIRQSAKDVPPPAMVPSKPSTLMADTAVVNSQSSAFRAFDFDQTSHHLQVRKIDIHLCDDAHANSGYPDDWNINSGAMQMTLTLLLIDIYPRTLAASDRGQWLRYTAPNSFTQWIESRLMTQIGALAKGLDETTKTRLTRCWPQLMSFNLVIRIHDLMVQGVSDMDTKKDELLQIFASERKARSLPNDQYIIHFEFANFFHPMSDTLPVPAPASFLQLGPFTLHFDKRTLRWCLYVAHFLSSALDESPVPESEPLPHTDLRVDLLMPKLVVPLPSGDDDRRLPHRLLISLSTLSLSNCKFRSGTTNAFRLLNSFAESETGLLDLLEGKSFLVSDLGRMANGINEVECEQFWLRTSPAWVETDHGNNTKPLPLVSDVSFIGSLSLRKERVNIYLEPTTAISAVIDHFQFLQLTRLAAQLADFFDLIARDQKHFLKGKEDFSPTISVVAALQQVRAHILLTMGAVPSPYDKCPAVIAEAHLMDCPSEVSLATRSNTPRRAPSVTPLNEQAPKKNAIPSANAVAVEEFPEFPAQPIVDYETASVLDDSMSIATSLEDESAFDFEMPAEDDIYPIADMAEEASVIDEVVINDRIFKSLMAKNGNTLLADLSGVLAVVNVYNKETLVQGSVNEVALSYKLNVTRSEAYDAIKKMENGTTTESKSNKQVRFKVSAPAETKVSLVELNLHGVSTDLDDEILSHLSPFTLDEQTSDNNVRLTINVRESDIRIHDRKKKKPLRLRIRDCVVEQEEDGESPSNTQ